MWRKMYLYINNSINAKLVNYDNFIIQYALTI
jgi:hypothetical protein